MKHLLFLLLLGGAGLGLAPTAAHAQTTPADTTRTVKPQLNTAPPGAAPARPRRVPATTPVEPQAAPTAPPVYQPDPNVPASQAPAYDPNRPSGLDLPQRPGVAPPPPPLRKYFLYTNFGLGYSSYAGDGQFNVSVSPAIGYRVSEKFAIGPGISYSYINVTYSPFNQQYYGYPDKIQYNNLGLKGFAQFIVYKQFFLHAEYEVTRLRGKATDSFGNVYTSNTTATTPLGGAGYRTRFGERFAADLVVLYNFNDGIDNQGNRNSPYGQPEIRFNFLFDLK
ncbi:hypothetical protein [Hymenobacter psychrophilus]|uniref:Outer membrane protein beta-barrel domain-containing protein n=1 Tax=Hymenobacter psychrophilus TaxID=651662 RepID=A0A1H3CQI0_9BACT|nr:hypothetical protein [Hymenobacter psychrophilus]SDX55689.1 hypothetical protein SAMN04488069_10257 [Hymenobacter psychrophilus]